MKTLGIAACAALALSTALIGCSSDEKKSSSSSSSGYTDHSSPYPSCDVIIKACHPYDIGEGDIHNCHDQGHEAKSEADCPAQLKDFCLGICQAAADAADGGGASDAGGEGSAPQ